MSVPIAGAARGPTEEVHPAPARSRVSRAALWFGLVGGPAAWSAQTLINLPTASHACFPQLFPLTAPAGYNASGVAFVVSIAAVVVCVAAFVVAWASWSRTRHEHHPASGDAKEHTPEASALETGEGRTRFMALAGLLSGVTFILVTVVHLCVVFLVAPCAS